MQLTADMLTILTVTMVTLMGPAIIVSLWTLRH